MTLTAGGGRVLYNVIREAMHDAGLSFRNVDNNAVLIWNDTIKDCDYFSALLPYQVVNRLPEVNILCRKAPFIRLIQRLLQFFPKGFTFVPKSFILPEQLSEFTSYRAGSQKKFIVKPDNGSLGWGIQILEPSQPLAQNTGLAIAQEYVESYLVDETKFDLRIYVLIKSVDPLQIYVFRGGIARFCSQKSEAQSIYSQLTNTAVNKQNPEADLNNITRMVSDVFKGLSKEGVNTSRLWQRIDEAIILSIFSAYPFLYKGQTRHCPSYGYTRCFQILGFDVLIDEKLNPIILEVNYRPSLECDTPDERAMKRKMLSDAIKIGAPLSAIQKILPAEPITEKEKWVRYLESQPSVFSDIEQSLKSAEKDSGFVKVFPDKNHAHWQTWMKILERSKQLPAEVTGPHLLPIMPDKLFVYNDKDQIPHKPSHTTTLPPMTEAKPVPAAKIEPSTPQSTSISTPSLINKQEQQTVVRKTLNYHEKITTNLEPLPVNESVPSHNRPKPLLKGIQNAKKNAPVTKPNLKKSNLLRGKV